MTENNKIPQEIEEKILKEFVGEDGTGCGCSKCLRDVIRISFEEAQKQTNEEVLKLIDNELKEVVKSLSNSYGKIRTKRFLESPKKYSMINNVGVYWRLLELKSKLSGGKE